MIGLYVNQLPGGMPYAMAIVSGYKKLETRNRNVLKKLFKKSDVIHVAIIRTMKNRLPLVVGYCDMRKPYFVTAEHFHDREIGNLHLVPIGSRYDSNKYGKYCYPIENAYRCRPYVPFIAVNHGYSYCEID